MSEKTICEMTLLVQADFDGELDATQAAAVEAHRGGCAICQTTYRDLQRIKTTLRAQDHYYTAPEELRRRFGNGAGIEAARSAGPFRRNHWGQWAASFGLGAAVAAGLALLLIAPNRIGVLDEVTEAHIRALQPGHLTDVVSTDRHTVKPWFDGKLDFAPPVKDLKEQGFPLEGGRLDYLEGRPVAALIYSRAKHQINFFVWPMKNSADSNAQISERNGYHVIHFVRDQMTVWVVSDLEKDQLAEFVRQWQAAS